MHIQTNIFSIILISTIMTQNLTVISWNVRGIMSSTLCLSNILQSYEPDVAIISEHKLSNENLMFLNTIHPHYTSLPQECHHDKSNHVSCLIKRSLMFSTSFITEYSNDRVTVLELHSVDLQKVYLVGVYLPYDSNIDNYKQYIEHLDIVINELGEKGMIILAGDLMHKSMNHCKAMSKEKSANCFQNL